MLLHRMAEEKQVDFDFTQDDEVIDSDSVRVFYCYMCGSVHPRYWSCRECDCIDMLWHCCCNCCHNHTGEEYELGCESCRDDWVDRHIDSDAETVPYDPNDDD